MPLNIFILMANQQVYRWVIKWSSYLVAKLSKRARKVAKITLGKYLILLKSFISLKAECMYGKYSLIYGKLCIYVDSKRW